MAHKSDRRTMLTTLGGAALAQGLLKPKVAQSAADSPLTAAVDFLGALPPESKKRVRFAFDDNVRRHWNFMGTRVKPGLPIEKMNDAQKDAANVLLQSLLSPSGYDKARMIMLCQDVMRELGDGPDDRNSERFSIAIFGEPAARAVWGIRIEGHHLSLSWTLRGDDLAAITPASFSVIPQHIPVGAEKGTVVLDREETLSRKLIHDLMGSKRAKAIFTDRLPGNVLAQAGEEGRFTTKAGIAVADVATAQQELLWELVETTCVEPWPSHIADQQQIRIREGDPASVHFAWAGGLNPGEMFYYRIHGDTFILEFTSVFGNPEHLHAIYHDPERTLGRHLDA